MPRARPRRAAIAAPAARIRRTLMCGRKRIRMEAIMSKSVCVVVGVGEGNGAALARAFAREGMSVALLARGTDFTSKLADEIGDARAYACDVTDPESVAQTFDRIRQDLGDPQTLIYNAGSGVWGDVERITLEDFESSWRVNAFG